MSLHYNAFISYKHAELDNKVAAQIEKALERYHIPKKIQKKTGVKKIERIFRDKDELPITSDLSGTIEDALRNSDYLIVLCSKSTCLSTWVEREITIFLQDHPIDRVLTVLAEGEPYEVIPKILLSRTFQRLNSMGQVETVTEPVEPLSCDWRLPLKEALNTELPRLAAALIGCSYNELMNRQRQYKMKRLTAMAAGVMGLSVGFGAYMLYSNHRVNENYQKALISQSKYLATESSRLLDEEQRINALYLALEALPNEENPDKPVVPEAVKALSNASLAYESKMNEGITSAWNYTMPDTIKDMIFPNGGAYMAAIDNSGNVRAWNCDSHEMVYDDSSFKSNIDHIFFAGKDILLLAEGDTVRAIELSTGQEKWATVISDDYFTWHTTTGDYKELSDGTFLLNTDRKGLLRISSEDGTIVDKYTVASEDETDDSISFSRFSVSPGEDKVVFKSNMDGNPIVIVYNLNDKTGTYIDLTEHGYMDPDEWLVNLKWVDDDSFVMAVGANYTVSNYGYLYMEVYAPTTTKIFCFNAEDLSLKWKNDFVSNAIYYDSDFIVQSQKNAVSYYYGDTYEVWDIDTGERQHRYDITDSVVGVTLGENNSSVMFITRGGAAAQLNEDTFSAWSEEGVALMYYFTKELGKAVSNKGVYTIPEHGHEILYYGVGVYDENYKEFKDAPTVDYVPTDDYIMSNDTLAFMDMGTDEVDICLYDLGSKEFIGRVTLDPKKNYHYSLLGIEDGKLYVGYKDLEMIKLYSVDISTLEYRETKIQNANITFWTDVCYKNGNMVYAIDGKNDDCVNIVVKDTRHGSAKQYEVEYAYESGTEAIMEYSPEQNLVYFSDTYDSIINTETGEVTKVSFPADWYGTKLVSISSEEDKIIVTDNSYVVVSDLNGEMLYNIKCDSNKIKGMTIHNGKLFIVTDKGDMYIYNSADGQRITYTDISYGSGHYENFNFLFDDENDRLYIQNGLVLDVIDTTSFIETAYVAYALGYHKDTDSFIVRSRDFKTDAEKVGYFKQYSLEELIQRGQKMLEGAEISDAFKDSYGIG